MGPWGTLTRVIAAVIVLPASVIIVSGLPWNLALTPVWAALLAGALTGMIGAAVENYVAVRLSAAARLVLWTGLSGLVLWPADTYLPGFHLAFWAGTVASLALGLVEAIIPAAVTEH
ncbi:MAG: hypothetical protein ACP5QO_12375 [Clostridia bacterium]